MALTKIPGNLIETGAITAAALDNDAVTTAKILDANITHAKLHTSMDLTGKTVTVATAAGSTNTTAAASTAFVQQELTTLIGGAPSTLNDLNELAAAINDDANYNSTLTTALATKLPLAGGTMTGNIVMGDNNITGINKLEILDSADNNRLEIYGNASNGFIFDMGGTGSTGTINFNDFNVGIGTNAPSHKLHVKNDNDYAAKFGGTGGGDYSIEIGQGTTNSSAGFNATGSGGSMLFKVQDTEYMRIKPDGKVGIGTNAPGRKLHIKDGQIKFQSTSSGGWAGLDFSMGNGTYDGYMGMLDSNGSFFIDVDSNGNDLVILQNGNVGIGTNNPNSPLHVKSSGTGNVLYVESSDGHHLGGFYQESDTRAAFNVRDASGNVKVNLDAGGNSWFTGGKVGIGTTSPGSLYSTANQLVIGDGSADVGMTIYTPSSGAGRIFFADGLSGGNQYAAFISYNHADQKMLFGTGSSGGTDVTIDQYGKVGIGIESPFSRLQSGGHTFSGGHGMHADARVGISNHGSLTGMMLASTYNDAAHPEYGLVFVQGPGTSSYNVWSISPDGPAKGNGLNFHYGNGVTNIHSPSYSKVTFKGDGHVGIGTDTPNQWASYTDSGATVLQVKSSGQRARIVAQGGDGAHLDLVDSGGASNDKHLNLAVDGGIGKFGSLTDTGGAWVQQYILTMDMGTGEVGIGGNLNLTDGKPIYSDTDSGTKLYTHLCTGSFYQGNNQGVAINTNIPSYNVTGNNMFAIYIKGYAYDNTGGGVIDCCIGTYSGEGAFHNNSYTAQNIPKQWQGKIRLAKNASDKLIILLGDTDTTTNYEIAVDCAVQGYTNVNTSYMENWTMSAFTSTSAYSGITIVQPKETQLIGFEAYSTGFTKTSGWHKISNSMSTESFDFGGYYDTSTGRFTPQVGGMYQFNVGGYSSYSSSTGQERYAYGIAKNGALNRIAGGNFCAGDSPLVSMTKNVYLNGTSDYVELWMYSAIGGSGITVGHASHPMWWEGVLISPSRGDTTWTI